MFCLISIGACLYSIPICFNHRFHTPLHLLSLNVCFAALVCCIYWSIFYIIVYKNKALFHTKKWVAICVCVQWIFALLIVLPLLASSFTNCLISGLELTYRIYILIITAIIPSISVIVSNSIIFIYARRSSRRVQPMNGDRALNHRDARLLKHMIFIFIVSFCARIPAYLVAAIFWNQNAVQLTILQGLKILPAVGLFITIIDLFWYNHELRKYFTRQRNNLVTACTN